MRSFQDHKRLEYYIFCLDLPSISVAVSLRECLRSWCREKATNKTMTMSAPYPSQGDRYRWMAPYKSIEKAFMEAPLEELGKGKPKVCYVMLFFG